MAETTYFQEGNVLITNIRAVLGTTTYPVANITSVSVGTIPPNRMIGVIIAIVGGLMAACSFGGGRNMLGGIIVGLIILAIGILIAVLQKTRYVVKIGSAGAEKDGLVSTDQAYIQRVVEAMNQAIIKRG